MGDNMGDREPDATVERLTNLGHLASGVGHNVINAFSAIVSNAELLRLDPRGAGIADPALVAETIIKTALEASTVARRLIDYTRAVTSIDSDQASGEASLVDLNRLIEEVFAAHKLEGPFGVSRTTELGAIPPIKGHADQLRAMLNHLITNAIESMTARPGSIKVTTFIDARGWVVIELRDSGQGMEAAAHERAVEPFFSTKPGHPGVGLSIANGIWRRHRGPLSIRSQPGEGTLVRLCVEPHKPGS
jgi:signal transduction histidine kinase